jgi:hypothetical protein
MTKKSEIVVSSPPSTSQNPGNEGQTRRNGLYETHAPGVMRYFLSPFVVNAKAIGYAKTVHRDDWRGCLMLPPPLLRCKVLTPV